MDTNLLRKPLFWLILLSGLALRLYFTIFHFGNFDTQSYYIVADIVRSGENVYANTPRYNYTPIWYTLIGIFDYIGNLFNVPLHYWIRGFLTLVDLCNVFLLVQISKRYESNSLLVFALCWLNPGLIGIVGYHGQFEGLALLPVLALLASQRRDDRSVFLAGMIAVVIKHNVVFIVWMLFVRLLGWKKAILYMSITVVVFLLAFLPALPEGLQGIQDNVLLYDSVSGYGFGIFLPSPITRVLFYGGLLILPFFAEKLSLTIEQSLALSAILFIGLAYGMGIQYFMLPLLLLAPLPQQRIMWIPMSLIAGIFYFGFVRSALMFLVLWAITLMWIPLFIRFRHKPDSDTETNVVPA